MSEEFKVGDKVSLTHLNGKIFITEILENGDLKLELPGGYAVVPVSTLKPKHKTSSRELLL